MAGLTVENQNVSYINTELVNENDNNVVQLEVGEDEFNINVAYGNETPTVFVKQGQYVIPVNGHAVVLQDQCDFEQYIVNDMVTGEEMQDSDQIEEEIAQPIIYYAGELMNHTQIFEEREDIVENEIVIEENDIKATVSPSKQVKLEQYYVDASDNNNENSSLDDDLVLMQEETSCENIIIAPESGHGQLQQPHYQYAILKNGKLHLQTLDIVDATTSDHFSTLEDNDHQQLQEQLAAFQQSINLDDPSTVTTTVDLDKITGKNLITGQTVTLDSYFDKLQRRLATVDVGDQCFTYNTKKRQRNDSEQGQGNVNKSLTADSNFINKKVVVGKTSNGKRIVGKILHIQTADRGNESLTEQVKETSQVEIQRNSINSHKHAKPASSFLTDTCTNKDLELTVSRKPDANQMLNSNKQQQEGKVKENEEKSQQQQLFQPHIIIKKHVVTRENFDYSIGKTLTGLMDLETIQRRLQNRNLVVKLVEKVYDHSTNMFNRTVSYVYGHMELVNFSESQRWAFVLHNENDDGEEDASDKNTWPLETAGDDCDGHLNPQLRKTNQEKMNDGLKTTCSDKDETRVENEVDTMKEVSLEMEETWARYNETVSLTILITVDKSGKKSTRVNLSPQQPDSQCHICSKEFKTTLQMRKHFNNVHSCEKSANCELCGKNFANQTVLQRHRKIHTGERWYQCPRCSKSFNTAGSLKRHVTVHNPSLRPLECSVCVQRFTDESSLRKHLLIHTGIRAFACEVCNRAFVNQGDLNFHRRIHDPIKQFSCEVCGREFSRHSNLMRHAEIHCGVGALHRCDICGCSYSFVSSLTRHIVQKHIGHQQQQ